VFRNWLPKAKLVLSTAIAGATPVPISVDTDGPDAGFVVTEIYPLDGPVADGRKISPIPQVPPGASTVPIEQPPTTFANGPVRAISLIVNVTLLLF